MARRKKKGWLSKSSAALSHALKNAKPSALERSENYFTTPQIGLGLESKFKIIRKVRKEDVHLDKNTQSNKSSSCHHALYTADWSLAGEAHE